MKIKLTPARISRLRPRKGEFTVWDAATPHLGIRVLPTGAMRYIHFAQMDGRMKKTTIGDAGRMSLDDARSTAHKLNAGEGKPKPPTPTFGEWVEVWRPNATPHLKPATIELYTHLLDRQLLPTFGKTPLDAIGRAQIHDWFLPYSRTSPGGANKALNLLGAILNHAVRSETITNNPVKRIRRNPGRKMTRFLSIGERENLLQVLYNLPERNRIKAMAVRMLLFTGCRCKEIITLRWDEVGDKSLNLTDSKTGARKVWLGKEARAILEEARSMHYALGCSDYVFPDTNNERHCLDVKTIGNFWSRVRVWAEIPDVRLHDLRHSFASEAVHQRVPLPVVSKLLGHSSISMTMRYVHASNKEVEAAAERIGRRLNAMLKFENTMFR